MTNVIQICVFAKKINPHKVKTRLMPRVNATEAAELAHAFLEDTWSLVSTFGSPILAVSEAGQEHFRLTIQNNIWPLGNGDLGERLESVAIKALNQPDTEGVLLMGADTPGLPPEYLTRAMDHLVGHDAVIGPAEDGGFYLLGLRRCPPGLFKNIPWSDAHTFANMMKKLKLENFNIKTLDPWFDVDRPEDLLRLKKMLDQREIVAPATYEVMKKIGLNR